MATQTDIDNYNAINEDLHEYADYLETDDLGRGLKYFTALNRAIDFRPQVSSRGSQGDELRFDLAALERKLQTLKPWLNNKRRISSARGGFHQRGTSRCDGVLN